MRTRDPATLTFSTRRFREEREEGWSRLEQLLNDIERRSPSRLSDDDLLALPVLYRSTLSSLSIARETSLDAQLIDYLEGLCTRAYFIVYGARQGLGSRLARFFTHDWPAAVRALWRETLVALALTLAGILAAYLLVRGQPEWFYSLIDADLASGRDPAASAASLRSGLYERSGFGDGLSVFATMLFTHNAQVSIFSFALGFAFGVPSALLLIYNGCMLGAFYAVYGPHGLALSFTGWLMIHGTTELFAILISGAAGFRIGLRIAFPGEQSRMAAATEAGRIGANAMIGVVIMLFVAGILEGVGRQTIVSDGARFVIAGVMLALWCLYFYLPRRRRHG